MENHGKRKLPILAELIVYLNIALALTIGYIFDIISWIIRTNTSINKDPINPDYVPLFKDFDNFYYRHIFQRIQLSWGRPVRGPIGPIIETIDRVTNSCNAPILTEKTTKMLNIGSYNYLGFGGPDELCTPYVIQCIKDIGISTTSSYAEFGQTTVLNELEHELAQFLGVESCVCFGMGFATNSCSIPSFIDAGCAILSDKLNHASLIVGARSSGAKVYVFPHNDMDALEQMVRRVIVDGQPRTNRPWKKIIILCEGIYSMEGTIVNLPRIIEIKKKYKIYVFLDEAHSIGALGPNGKGVVDYFNCDPKDIDILMGTFSKSFGAVGGYVAGTQQSMDYIRCNSYYTYYANCMAPPIAAQCLVALREIMNTSPNNIGSIKIKALRQNTRYFRDRLEKLGYYIEGDRDSPVVPLIFGLFGITHEFSMFMSRHNIGAIIVGFPATALDGARSRFCISASHTIEMLDYIISKIDEFGVKYKIKYFSK